MKLFIFLAFIVATMAIYESERLFDQAIDQLELELAAKEVTFVPPIIGEKFTNGCVEYMTAQECEDYAKTENNMDWGSVGTWSHIPKGCFYRPSMHTISYNNHEVGRGNGNTKPVCNPGIYGALIAGKKFGCKQNKCWKKCFGTTTCDTQVQCTMHRECKTSFKCKGPCKLPQYTFNKKVVPRIG